MLNAFARTLALTAALSLTANAIACEAHDAGSKSAMSTPAVDMMTTAGHDGVEHVHAGDIEITGYWVRAMLPNQPVAGGFLTLANKGADDRIIKASSPRAGRMELHEMVMDGDVMKMREIEGGIAIPAGATVELKPGGLHIMFFDIAERFEEGQTVPVTLTFEKAGEVTLELPVKDMKEMQGMDHSQMDHSKMGHGQGDHAQMDMTGMPDAEQITHVMKGQFDTPENPLTVAPVAISGEFAVASWSQDGKGGRALLKKGEAGWAIHLCTGAAAKDASNLEKMSVPAADAAVIAQTLAKDEAELGAEKIAQFDSFEGTLMIEGGEHAHGQHKHGG